MPTTPQELLLALAAPVLAIIILLLWLLLRVKQAGSTNLHLRFLGLSLDIRSCEFSEAECRAIKTGKVDIAQPGKKGNT